MFFHPIPKCFKSLRTYLVHAVIYVLNIGQVKQNNLFVPEQSHIHCYFWHMFLLKTLLLRYLDQE